LGKYAKHTSDVNIGFMKNCAWSSERTRNLKKSVKLALRMWCFILMQVMRWMCWNIPTKSVTPIKNLGCFTIEGYAYLVPFVESDVEISLKPSSPATKPYFQSLA
jgi:hypothetical protein